MWHMDTNYPPESAGSIMSPDVLVGRLDFTREDVIRELRKETDLDDSRRIYVVDKPGKLLGYAKISDVIRGDDKTQLHEIMHPFSVVANVSMDQEKAVFLAVKNDLDSIPVINDNSQLVGVLTAKTIIDVLHSEHVEDVLYGAGIRKNGSSTFIKLASARIVPVLKARAPWLIFGAIVGIGLGLVSRQFAASLEKTIALAYFVPVVAYIADSVGTQSEAITVRALAIIKINYFTYLLREAVIGLALGAALGLLGFIGAFVISGESNVAVVVGVSLLAASFIATVVASLIPIIFKAFGKDPALGSGPIATALQDLISVTIYFVFALVIIGV